MGRAYRGEPGNSTETLDTYDDGHYPYDIVEHRLTGAGDNQVVAVRFQRAEDLQAMADTVKSQLAAAFCEIGLSVKVEETWYSADLLCYQRVYHHKGKPCDNSIKPSVRGLSGGSDINAGINEMITTAMNSGTALNLYTPDGLIGLIFAYMESFTNIRLHPGWCAHLVMTSDFGYLPFIPLAGFIYSGHQDPLCESFALLRSWWA